MNKRGFIKTLEAVLAVIIVFIFIFSMSQKENKEDSNVKIMRNIQEGLLEGINKNEDFRNCIISASNAQLIFIGTGSDQDSCKDKGLKEYIMETLPSRFAKAGNERYEINVCDPTIKTGSGSCSLPSSLSGKKYLYTSGVVISSTFGEGVAQPYNPRVFRIWMW